MTTIIFFFALLFSILTFYNVLHKSINVFLKGGIGNFIKTEQSSDLIGCLRYTFDLQSFLSAEYFKEVRANHLTNLIAGQKTLESKIKEITALWKQ